MSFQNIRRVGGALVLLAFVAWVVISMMTNMTPEYGGDFSQRTRQTFYLASSGGLGLGFLLATVVWVVGSIAHAVLLVVRGVPHRYMAVIALAGWATTFVLAMLSLQHQTGTEPTGSNSPETTAIIWATVIGALLVQLADLVFPQDPTAAST